MVGRDPLKNCQDHTLQLRDFKYQLQNLLSYPPFEKLGSDLNSAVKLASIDFFF